MADMREQLLPCPFCGDMPEINARLTMVSCVRCHASGPNWMRITGCANLFDAWNRRALAAQPAPAGEASVVRVGKFDDHDGVSIRAFTAAGSGDRCISIRHPGGDTWVPMCNARDNVLWEALDKMARAAAAASRPATAVPEGWRIQSNSDGSIGLFAPPPTDGESRRTSHAFYPGPRGDAEELIYKLLRAMLSAAPQPATCKQSLQVPQPAAVKQDLTTAQDEQACGGDIMRCVEHSGACPACKPQPEAKAGADDEAVSLGITEDGVLTWPDGTPLEVVPQPKPAEGGAVEMSPEFTDTARGAIAWVLYHHQGGSSAIGQPLRYALGLGAHEDMPTHLIQQAKHYASAAGRSTADFHAPAAATRAEEVEDAERYRYIRDLPCCTLSISKNEGHAINYTTMEEWVDSFPELYDGTPGDELRRMVETNTDWSLQIYPDTPIGFNVWHGSTLDAVIDEARRLAGKGAPRG